jgi:nucleoside-diphosphate-sugar epimerase
VRNIAELARVSRGADAVLHLAAVVGDASCGRDPDYTWATNVEATKLVVDVCRQYSVERLVLASTCSVYGASDDLILNEGSLRRPVSLYAETRIVSEDICVRAASPDFVVTSLRMATLYGLSARMRFDLAVNVMAAHAARERRVPVFGGDQWRPLVHAADAAAAFALVLDAPAAQVNGQVFNIGSDDQNVRIAELGRRVATALGGVPVEMQPAAEDDRRNYRVSFAKAAHLLGFRVRRTIEEACSEIGTFLRAHPEVDYHADRYHNHRYPYAIDPNLPPRERAWLRASDADIPTPIR